MFFCSIINGTEHSGLGNLKGLQVPFRFAALGKGLWILIRVFGF